jgi:two-component system C4-dicarboxylate transport response regulator DctD
VKLLRVLQERHLERLGGNDPIAVNCRIIAASKGDLLKMSEAGSFRADLYYRIGVVNIDLPRLAERRDDIPLLLAHFVQRAASHYQHPMPRWTQAQMAQWQAREWPGNVRELRNFADRLVLGVADPETAPVAGIDATRQSLSQRMDAYERILISQALAGSGGSVTAAADALGVPKKTLYDKLKKHKLGSGRVLE